MAQKSNALLLPNKLDFGQDSFFLQDKLTTLGMLSAGLTHEINNSLSLVVTNLDDINQRLKILLAVKSKFNPLLLELNEIVNFSIDGADRIIEIIQDVKNFLRVDEDSFELIDIHQVLDEVINIIYPQFKYKSIIKKNYSNKVPKIFINRNKLNHVFINIIINAAQSIKNNNIKNNLIEIKTLLIKEKICIKISDTGSGIPKNIIANIFQPFFTTKPPGVGTGLGLPIARCVVEGCGGNISVFSREDKGSIFSIYLPIKYKKMDKT